MEPIRILAEYIAHTALIMKTDDYTANKDPRAPDAKVNGYASVVKLLAYENTGIPGLEGWGKPAKGGVWVVGEGGSPYEAREDLTEKLVKGARLLARMK